MIVPTAMFRRQAVPLVVVLLVLAGPWWSSSLLAQKPPTGPSLTLLDGQTVAVKSLAISQGKLSGDGVPSGLTLDDLKRIELAAGPAPAADKPAVAAELRGGGRLSGKSATIAGEKCLVEWSLGEKLAVPIDAVRCLRFRPGDANPELDKAVAAPAAAADRIFFQVDGKSESVAGVIVSLTSEQLTFQLEGQERKLPRGQLLGIVVAQPQAQDDATRCTVMLRDGSQLAGDLVAAGGETAALALPGGGKLEFPWSAAVSVLVRSSRVAYLSDLKPLAVDESALVTLSRPWQRDKSVMGRPLAVGAQKFERGIGVHARSSLTFAAERKYDVLAATIGIDAETAGKGDCVFVVLADGQPIFTKRVKGTDPPQELRIEVSQYAQLTLAVEPGEGLDLADHADWCDVRLIRNK